MSEDYSGDVVLYPSGEVAFILRADDENQLMRYDKDTNFWYQAHLVGMYKVVLEDVQLKVISSSANDVGTIIGIECSFYVGA